MTSGLPFDDFRDLLRRLPGPDETAARRVRETNTRLAKPDGSLGRLEDIAEWLAAWSGRAPPAVARPLVAIFAGTHGVERQGDSAYQAGHTAEQVELCAAGGAAINQVCAAYDLGLKVFDLALDLPTGDIREEAALDERACAATMAFGMEAIQGADLLCIGDLGGNEVVAAALLAALFGGRGQDWVMDGADKALTAHRIEAVDLALALHGKHLQDPLEALRRVGGREFAAIAGAILAARMQKVPVIIDGPAATAAAAVLHKASDHALHHCLLAQALPQYPAVGDRLGLRPLLDLGISHGEGVVAALVAGIAKAAALTHSGMAAALKR